MKKVNCKALDNGEEDITVDELIHLTRLKFYLFNLNSDLNILPVNTSSNIIICLLIYKYAGEGI